MDIVIHPQKLSGTIQAIPSKSQAHRLLICAAFADQKTVLYCPNTNRDIEATAACLRALGASILQTDDGYIVTPIHLLPDHAELPCDESGSTLRFMLPIVGALGVDSTFTMQGRLPTRPLSPLWEEMERMGCSLSRPTLNTIHCTGQLRAGTYVIASSISSQFITGLLFALSLLQQDSYIQITGTVESKPYIDMTQNALSAFCIDTTDFYIRGNQSYRTPKHLKVEGDWSNGAFFLAAGFLGNTVEVNGLQPDSSQGDRAIANILPLLSEKCTICASDIPDLVPILSVTAAANKGAVFTNIQRLRLKESDRVSSVINMLSALGIQAVATESTLTVFPGRFRGGLVDSANDHRIAMAAAIAATLASEPVVILDAHCVAKSYPQFWEEYTRLGGYYEQHIR